MDVFGGVKGDAKETVNPFAIDRQKALSEVALSIDMFEGRRVRKKSVLQSMREGTFGEEEKSIHWEYNKQNETNFDIILSWGQKEISRVKNLTRKEARIALNGLRVFYDTINVADPDFTHPDICHCFNITAAKYKLEKVEVPKKLDRNLHRHPFAGVMGDLRDFKNNLLAKEVLKAQELVNFTQEFLEIVELPFRKREPKYRISSTPLAKPTFEDLTSHYDVKFIFANKLIQSENNVPVHRAKVAIASLRGWLKKIDVETPNLADENLNLCYEALKSKTKPTLEVVKDERLLSMEDGGSSFWSDNKHNWIKGHIDRSGNFIPPDWTD